MYSKIVRLAPAFESKTQFKNKVFLKGFPFESSEERLARRIIIAVTGGTHALNDSPVAEPGSHCVTGVWN